MLLGGETRKTGTEKHVKPECQGRSACFVHVDHPPDAVSVQPRFETPVCCVRAS
jgi:hypothetical protein